MERRVKRPGWEGDGSHLKVSSGEMASRVVVRVPMESQPRYLLRIVVSERRSCREYYM
jgi:hypothetical protein